MALFIAKTPQFTASKRVPSQIGVRWADLRPSSAENQAIGSFGDLLILRADEMKKERDAAVVGDLYNQWRDADRQALSELLSRKGKDAIDLDQDYDKFYNESQGKADEQAENGSQQRALKGKLSLRRESSLDILAKYEGAEAQRYKAVQEKGVLDNALASAREQLPYNEVALGKILAEAWDSTKTFHPGLSDEDLIPLQKELTSQILSASAKAQINEDPVKALENIENWKEALGDRYYPLKNKVKPIKEAYETDDIVARAVVSVKETNPDAPFDIGKRYDEVKRLTDNPTIRKAAFAELQRLKIIHDKGIKERFDYNYSAISSALQQNKNLTINGIKKMPEYGDIPESQRDDALAKAQVLIDHRSREERAVSASERAAAAAERTQSNQSSKEEFNNKYSAISLAIQRDDKLTIDDVEKMPEFLALPVNQRDDALSKAQKLINQQKRETRAEAAARRSEETERRAADAAERANQANLRAEASAIRAEENQKIKDQNLKYDAAFNTRMSNETLYKELGTMSDNAFNALALDVGLKNQSRLLKERLKLKKDTKYLSIARQRSDIVNDVLTAANITNESDRTLYHEAVLDAVGDETDIAVIKKKAAEAMQNAAIERPWYWWDRVTITEGKKIVGTKDGENVYELDDGQWQIGE